MNEKKNERKSEENTLKKENKKMKEIILMKKNIENTNIEIKENI